MNIEELEELTTAMARLVTVQSGIITAHRVAIDALIGAIGLSLPPLLGAIADNLDGLQVAARDGLEPDAIMAFDNTVAQIQDGLRILQR